MNKPRVWTMFAALLVWVAAGGVVAAIGLYLRHGPAMAKADLETGLSGLLLSVGSTAVAALFTVGLFARPLSAARLGLRRFRAPVGTWLAMVLGVVATSSALGAAVEVAGLQDLGTLGHLQRVVSQAGAGGLVQAALVVGLLAGVTEELLFRGLVQPRLVQRWGVRAGILITSGLFGLVHFDLIQSTVAFGLGICLGLVRERAGSVLPAMAAHVVNNLVAVLGAASAVDPPRWANALVGLGALALAALCLRYLRRTLPASASQTAPELGDQLTRAPGS